jgi:Bacteriocin-protection, YdeI or OmpD-Associated
MSDYVTFDGRIEPMVWGKSTYTILRIPPAIVDALGNARRVEGDIAEHPINLAPTRAPVVEGAFLWAGQSLLDRIGIAPGDVVEVRLRPAPDDRVDLPDDVALAMRAAGVSADWDALTPGKRRGLLYKIDTAKTDVTRQKRIASLVAELSA